MNVSGLEYTSFLVRLWRETPEAGEAPADRREWLVQVEHIPGGEKMYLASLEDLFAFIRRRLPGLHATEETQPSAGAIPERGDKPRNTRF